MQIDRIGRDKSYEMVTPYGLKVWDKVSVSGTISPSEDIQQAYKELDKILEEAHQATLSGEDEMKGTKVRDIAPEPKIDILQGALDEIEKCTNMDELKGLWLISKSNLTLSAAYKVKEKQLTNVK